MVWHSVPSAVQLLFPKRLWKGESADRQVYLTFDDGPVPDITDFVLNELAKRNQKATFFMVGDNLRKFPELGKAVLQSGHTIGNHTHNHLNGWKTTNEAYFKNVEAFDQILEKTLGIQTDLFRPPYGLLSSYQAKKVSDSKRIVMWNVLSGDYDIDLNPNHVLSKTQQHTRAGSIIVFHDQQKTKSVLKAILPDFLDFLHENNFRTNFL